MMSDGTAVGRPFEGKVLLVTGGTGTFGHAVMKRFLGTGIKEIRVFSRDEKKQDDMRLEYRSSQLTFHLGDVRDLTSCQDAMSGVDYVFHAAALKQVPSCDFFPMEAIRTNAIGADNVMQAACQAKVSSVVMLSTDKAVYPVNAMGMSKALMERLMVARSRVSTPLGTTLCATRYGNVMASRGSVIPRFVNQILSGQPLTITDPKMTRFMMSIEEAVDLVLFAFTHGSGGDIFVRKAPAADIETVAVAICEIFNVPQNFQIIGSRHGEKRFETLLTREERLASTDFGEYFRVSPDHRDMNYAAYFEEGTTYVDHYDYDSNNTVLLTVAEMKDILNELDVVKEGLAGKFSE